MRILDQYLALKVQHDELNELALNNEPQIVVHFGSTSAFSVAVAVGFVTFEMTPLNHLIAIDGDDDAQARSDLLDFLKRNYK